MRDMRLDMCDMQLDMRDMRLDMRDMRIDMQIDMQTCGLTGRHADDMQIDMQAACHRKLIVKSACH
jgi:hypothetical protein